MRLLKLGMGLLVLAWFLAGSGASVLGSPREWGGVFGRYEVELPPGSYFSLYGEGNKLLHRTAHRLYEGDEFITAQDVRYRVVRVEGRRAYAVKVGKEQAAVLPKAAPLAAGRVARGGSIAIYHTHSDESYVPSDGTASRYASGGIFKVGSVFEEKLRSLGFDVLHSMRPHDPHDANAYYRSRRTAAQLLQKRPLALIDVHRDAVPPDVYSTVIRGEPVTRVKIVVGRENPRMSANLQFAKQLKAAAEEIHPGLIEGILIARGDFNQDLAPHALLVEVGAHTNSREAAQRGIALFADALPRVLGITGVRPEVAPETGRSSWRALFWGVLLVGGLLAGFLYFNAGSWDKVREQVRRFFAVGLLGRRRER